MSSPREVRVAPNIYRYLNAKGEHVGWRVYVRGLHEQTGKSQLQPRWFPPGTTLEALAHFRDSHKLEIKRLRLERRATGQVARARPATELFPADADRYLQLEVVQALESYTDRVREIEHWKRTFRRVRRRDITIQAIDAELQRLHNAGYAGATVNKFRAALMAIWTQLDGVGAANPVKATKTFPEAEEEARGQDYALLTRILDEVPADRTRPTKGVKGSRKGISLSRIRLGLMVWTGMAPVHIARLEPAHFSIAERWYVLPRRKKGKRVRRPPPIVRLPMNREARKCFRLFVAAKAWGPFDRRDLRKTWLRAVRNTEKAMQQERNDQRFTLPHIRLYDIRHSFGTAVYAASENLEQVATMLGNTPRTARRYSLGAVPAMLKKTMAGFERRTGPPTRKRPPAKRTRSTGKGRRRT